jgi:hypothetical protein
MGASSEVLPVSAASFLCAGKSFEFEPISSLTVQNHLGTSNSLPVALLLSDVQIRQFLAAVRTDTHFLLLLDVYSKTGLGSFYLSCFSSSPSGTTVYIIFYQIFHRLGGREWYHLNEPFVLNPSSCLSSLIFGQIPLPILLPHNNLPISNSALVRLVSQPFPILTESLEPSWKRSLSRGAEIDLCLVVDGLSFTVGYTRHVMVGDL